ALSNGDGTIPTDNVACFLRRAGYAAIVPGKYDFYYGPERLRELARFLASPEEAGGYRPVEMLGANLVIDTEWKSDHKPVGDSQDPPHFAPWIKPQFADKNQNLAFPTAASPKDGGKVYPWLPGAELNLMNFSETSNLLLLLRRSNPKTKSELGSFLASQAGKLTGQDEQDRKTLSDIISAFPWD